MKLTKQQEKLLNFVIQQHATQLRKYVHTPYWEHPYSVASLVSTYVDEPLVIEIALCHDLFEDTKCTQDDLYDALTEYEYTQQEKLDVLSGVEALTDHFTKERYPKLNRAQRKQKEAELLGSTHHKIQSIKYADLIDNTSTIVKYDPVFAVVYLSEKRKLLNEMRRGNIDLFILACATLHNAEAKLNEIPA